MGIDQLLRENPGGHVVLIPDETKACLTALSTQTGPITSITGRHVSTDGASCGPAEIPAATAPMNQTLKCIAYGCVWVLAVRLFQHPGPGLRRTLLFMDDDFSLTDLHPALVQP